MQQKLVMTKIHGSVFSSAVILWLAFGCSPDPAHFSNNNASSVDVDSTEAPDDEPTDITADDTEDPIVVFNAPHADAGPDQVVDEGALVELDGSGSSANSGGTLEFLWVQTGGPKADLEDADTTFPRFIAPLVDHDEFLEFALQVQYESDKDEDSVRVQVRNVPQVGELEDDPEELTECPLYYEVHAVNQEALHDLRSPATLECTAFSLDGNELPDGTYTWHLDDQPSSGRVDTHAQIVFNISESGSHSIRLSFVPTGMTDPFPCTSDDSGNAETMIYVSSSTGPTTPGSGGGTGGGGGGAGGGETPTPPECTTDAECDNGLYCDGAETCVSGSCEDGTAPCGGLTCDETSDDCASCIDDVDCNDDLFCNGEETCVDGECESGASPCAGSSCDEASDSCFTCTVDNDCDDGIFCNGQEICDLGQCAAGAAPCNDSVCDEDTESCVGCLTHDDCQAGELCDPGSFTCVVISGPAVSGTIRMVDTKGARPPIGETELAFTGSGSSDGVDFIATTDAMGRYSQPVPSGWTGTVSADNADRLFLTPLERDYDDPITDPILGQDFTAWKAPIGIPAPGFGLFETVESVYGDPDYYTYYIDNSDIGCTDIGNPNGSEALPRCTIPFPFPLEAGDVVLIKGGPYHDPNHRVQWIQGIGTAQAPIFIRGDGVGPRPQLNNRFETRPRPVDGENQPTQYVIFENLDFDGQGQYDGGLGMVIGAHHVVMRHCEAYHNVSNSSVTISGEHGEVHNLVVYNNRIHQNGQVNAECDQDFLGVAVSLRTYDTWILDNELAYNSSNGLQVNAGTNSNHTLHHIYIGRNLSHHNKQAGLGFKQCSDVIVSENVLYGARVSNSNYGEGTGAQYSPENLWLIYNRISNSPYGLRFSATQGELGQNIYMVGNVIYNIHHEFQTRNLYDAGRPGTGISVWGGDPASGVEAIRHIIHNTLYSVEAGISVVPNLLTMEIANNIIAGVSSDDAHVQVGPPIAAGRSSLRANLFDGTARIRWGSGSQGPLINLTQLAQQHPGQGSGSIEAEPRFKNVPEFCEMVRLFEYFEEGVLLDESVVDEEMRSTLTFAQDVEALGVRSGDRVEIIDGSNTTCDMPADCGGAWRNIRCQFLNIKEVQGQVITLERDITGLPASDLEIRIYYYPATQTELYVEHPEQFEPGDVVEYADDGIARTVLSVTSDARGSKIILTPGSQLDDDVRRAEPVCNWKDNTDVTEDFDLLPDSPAIDTAPLESVFDTFETLYGLDLREDVMRRTRPKDGDHNGSADWDFGAFECSE